MQRSEAEYPIPLTVRSPDQRAFACVTSTPFGFAVVPEVKRICEMSFETTKGQVGQRLIVEKRIEGNGAVGSGVRDEKATRSSVHTQRHERTGGRTRAR